MKSIFSTIMNNSLFNFAKRLAITCVFLSLALVATAGDTYYSKMIVKVSSTGGGLVYVQDSGTDNTPDYKESSEDTYSGWENKTHSYKCYAEPEPGYTLNGWSTSDNGTIMGNSNLNPYIYNGDNNWVTSKSSTNPTTRTLYAIFSTSYNYTNTATVKVVGASDAETLGWVYVDAGEKEYAAITDDEWKSDEAQYGDGQQVNRPTYTYTYYAKANTTDDGDPTNDYTFIGWSTSPDGTGIIPSKQEFVYTSQWNEAQANPLTPMTLYALFRKDKYYFYQDASAFVVGESAGGEVRITYDKESQTTEWSNEIIADVTNAHNFKATTTDETENFTITYEAKNIDANLYAFWGWGYSQSSIPTEAMKSLKYTETYTVSQKNTSSDSPLQIDPLYAIFKSYYYNRPAVLVATNSKDAGKVYIDLTGTGTTDGYKDAIYAEEQYIQVPADNAHSTYTCHYYAKANTGAEFRGWSTTADGKNIISTNEHYSVTYEVKSTDSSRPDVASPLYAVFASYIDIQQQDRMICYVDNYGNYNINDTKIIMELLKAPKLVAELKTLYPDNDNFSLSNAKASQVGNRVEFDATQGLINLKLAYVGDLSNAIGKMAYITLTGLNGDDVIVERTISVIVEKAPVVTFVPTDGKGAYSVSLTDGSGVFYPVTANAKENLQVQIAQESMANIEMKLTSPIQNGDYIFFAWKKIEGSVSTYISTEPTCVHEFTEPAVVQAEFIHKDQATFIIKSQPEKVYADLQLALNEASVLKTNTGKDQVVVFANEFANSTEDAKKQGVLPRGNYTIPKGITLLIPADNTYTPICGDPKDYYIPNGGDAKLYRKLIVESGTTFSVFGNISLSVDAIYNAGADNYQVKPGGYGQIELQGDAKITLNAGAGLYAFGYVTGDKSSSITALSGATVWELFQFSDYRGGSATAAMYQSREDDKVFPMSQYYIQNVEVALEFKYGSTEYLSSGAPMSGSVTALSSPFISSNNVEGTGLFNIGENASIIKYYDPITDRLKVTIRGGNSSIGYLRLDLGWFIIMNVTIDSRDYVLPINNNMDIILESTNVEVPYDMAWLPGATLSVDKYSTVEINGANIYVYDKDESVNNVNGTYANEGYFASLHSKLYPIKYTPNGSHLIGSNNKRTWENLEDAKWIIDGKVHVKSGGLYTTKGKAQLVSNTNGQVQFNTTLFPTYTYQSQYVLAGDADILLSPKKWRNRIDFPVESASLQNADNTHESTSYGTFTYNPAKGKWEKTTQLADTWTIPSITIHKPNEPKNVEVKSFISGVTTSDNLANLNITISGDGFSKGDVRYDPGVGLVIPISYQASGVAGEYIGTITISDGGQTFTQLITATEDYTPRYDIFNTPLETYVNTPIPLKPFIASIEDNVTELTDDANMKWDWSISGDAANQFQLQFGEGGAKLLESQLIFTPSSTGTKTAMLHLTASYTDKGGNVYSTTKEIPLTGIAKALEENTLAFANLSTIYKDQPNATSLFTGSGSNQDVEITVQDENGEAVVLSTIGIVDQNETSTITPKQTGTYTITAKQEKSATIAATSITTTITIYPRVKWNWENLYYGNTYTDPITILGGKTDEWTLTKTSDIKDVIIYDADNKSAKVRAWDSGEAEVQFTFSQQGQDDIIFTTLVHRDPRKVRVDVNDLRTFKAVNAGTQGVKFDELKKTISFTSPAGEISQWVMNFIGVPDELCFTPTQGGNAWQIEESSNGINWTTSYTWAAIENNTPFSLSLSPTTQFIRISYGSARVQNVAVLDKLYVTALQSVKSDVDQLYMPIVEPSSRKDVVLTYASIDEVLTLSTSSDKFTLSDYTLEATTEENPYYVKTVVVTSIADAETPGAIYVKKGDKLLLDIPVYPYEYPQDLPILLETDPIQRYHFVTTKSYHTEWDELSRTILFDNAVSDAEPFVTFHFSDSPTPGLISFKSNANGTWRIEESANELDWDRYDVKKDANQMVVRTLKSTSRHIRLTYVSSYAEVVEVSNLSIVPTSTIMVDKTDVVVFKGQPVNVKVTANNLETAPTITCSSDKFSISNIASSLVGAGTREADLEISYTGDAAMESGTISFLTGEKLLATIHVVGRLKTLSNGVTGIKTGLKDGYTISNPDEFEGKENEDVDISSAFAGATPLFDYVFIFGETSTTDEQLNVTAPNNGSGSNAVTPCYVYKKAANGYDYYAYVENVNTSSKIEHIIPTVGEQSTILDLFNETEETLRVYVTGFCPYASTGYTKQHEGVFFFRGNAGDTFDVYLENCYLYSRYKTYDGHSFIDRSNGESFSENYVRGSGGVLVFECGSTGNGANPMNVTIHTSKRNVLKSHYGCFFESIVGRAFQVSSPVQIHMAGGQLYVEGSYTTLNFDDIWPVGAEVDVNGKYNNTVRTNGFLALKKQVNNAPSIDLGNPLTVVNFNGGRVELQNAQNVSDNYKTTMAISHRSGEFAGFLLAYGLGSDAAGGTVNFTDGTTTVQRMKVDERYSQYYLMDEDRIHTSCLRCPANTYITGGSHCMMRACSEPTSVGGAPRNKPATEDGSKLLGLYKYPKNPEFGKKGGWSANGDKGLVTPTVGNVPDGYGVKSVSPNTNGTVDASDDFLNFWFDPNFEPSVTPEVDKKLTFWKAAMTFIEASYAGFTRSIGGPTTIEHVEGVQTEAVTNLLYCQIDQNISDVIRNNYSAPVKNPTPSGGYEEIRPTTIGTEYENYVTNVAPYKIDNKVYYIATIPSADVWMSFTAPFNVEKIYVVESFDESYLEVFAGGNKNMILKEQARHNADFAAFFGVAMALGSDQPFDMIYKDYIGWAKIQDGGTTKREMREINHYYRLYDNNGKLTHNNWSEADFYLYKNTSNWTKKDDETYNTNWDFVVQNPDTKVLLEKGSVYSMFFPYCIGCWDETYERSFWDYWSGKFLVFESTAGGASGHEINGSDFVGSTIIATKQTNLSNETTFTVNTSYTDGGDVYAVTPSADNDDLAMTGNATFAPMGTMKPNVYIYSPSADDESFDANLDDEQNPVSEPTIIKPTESFLIGKELTDPQTIKSISRTGKITYFDSNNGNQNGTSGHMPTVGGGNDLFITSIAGGINVAVAAPQNVRVLSSTGAVIYSGYIQTAVDIKLPTNGIYIVSGENEVQKILF